MKRALHQVGRFSARFIAVRTPLPYGFHAILVVAGFILCAAFYAWLSTRPENNATFIPPFNRLWEATVSVFSGDDLWTDVRASFGRVTAGFLLAALIGIPVGLLIGSFRSAEALTQPVLEFFRYVPVPALIPMIMIFCGIGEAAKIALIFVGTFFQLSLMTADEVRRVPHELVQAAHTLGARRNEIVAFVLFRASLPGIFDALRLCNGWAWTYVVVAELVAATEGLGFRTLRFYRFIQTPQILVYLVVLGVIGLTLDLLFRALRARLFRWADATRR